MLEASTLRETVRSWPAAVHGYLQRSRVVPYAIGIAVTALGLALRVHEIGRESLWLDEGFTYARARLPVERTIQESILAQHNPSYFVFMHYWLQLGDDEATLRLPSAIFGALACAFTALMGGVLGGRAAAWVSGTLLALAPVHVLFGQETRMYAHLTCSAALAMAGLLWLGMHPEPASVPILGTHKLWRRPRLSVARQASWAYAAYVLGMIVSLYLHNTAVAFGFAALCAVSCFVLPAPRARAPLLVNFVAANVIVCAVWGFYLATELRQVEHFRHTGFWAKFPTSKQLVEHIRELYLMTAPWPSGLALLLIAAALSGLWALRRRPGLALGVLCLSLVGPALLLLISLYKPLFGVRLVLWVTPAFMALIALGATRRWPWLSALLFVGVVGYLVRPRLELDYQLLKKEPWREVVSLVQSKPPQQDNVVLLATREEAMMFDYYLHRRSHPLADMSYRIAPRRGAWKQKEIRDAKHVWLVDRKAGRRIAAVLRELEAHGRVVTVDRTWRKHMRVIGLDKGSR